MQQVPICLQKSSEGPALLGKVVVVAELIAEIATYLLSVFARILTILVAFEIHIRRYKYFGGSHGTARGGKKLARSISPLYNPTGILAFGWTTTTC